MKRLLLFLISSGACTSVFAQWAVFDVANLQQSVVNHAAFGVVPESAMPAIWPEPKRP